MHIILGEEAAAPMRSKYTVLPLDDMKVGDAPVLTAYCIVENLPVTELEQLEHTVNLHNKLVENYKKPKEELLNLLPKRTWMGIISQLCLLKTPRKNY